jgi:CheY-like chemotaxis protein/HPt (histidine-containing phosphotransfer) domain-containing protein
MQENEIGQEIDYKSLGHRKVLVAEDVELNQYLARHILESWDFEVVIANNGREAIEAVGEDSFDCILMDVQMPEMDGMEATHHIRSMPDAVKARIPIIALTANALKGDSEKYLAAGMTDYLAKPFDEERLFRVISRNLTPADAPVSASAVSTSNGTGPATSKIDIPLINTTTMSADSRLYDLTMVQSVSGGDEGFIKKMVALFIETVPQNVQDLKKALQEENWEQVGKTAHKLKSTIDSMGIKSIRQEIREVEANAKALESLQTIPSLVATIDTVINECIGQLQAEVLN